MIHFETDEKKAERNSAKGKKHCDSKYLRMMRCRGSEKPFHIAEQNMCISEGRKVSLTKELSPLWAF